MARIEGFEDLEAWQNWPPVGALISYLRKSGMRGAKFMGAH